MISYQSLTWCLALSLFVRQSRSFSLLSKDLSETSFERNANKLFASVYSNAPNDFLPQPSTGFVSQRNRLAGELLRVAEKIGQVGKDTTAENRAKIDQLAEQLSHFSDPHPARVSLKGTHALIYSGSEVGHPAGRLGLFVGEVTQVFWNETVYQNRVHLGPLQVSIFANRQVLNDDEIEVCFYETQIHLFDKLVLKRSVDLGHPGIWKHLFVGQVTIGNEKMLLRVMNTPKLYVLTQPIDA